MSPPRSDLPSDDRPLTIDVIGDDRDLLHAALSQAQVGIAIFDTGGGSSTSTPSWLA
jgi:hypothetical protein